MSRLDDRIDYLQSKVPAAERHPDDPRDRRVLKDRWWRRQARWAEAARAMVLLTLIYFTMNTCGYRVVDRKDAELAGTVTRIVPNAYRMAEADLHLRLTGRAVAIAIVEVALGTPASPTGWIASSFVATPKPELVRREQVFTKIVDRLSELPLNEVGRSIDRLFVLAHHFGETSTVEALEQLAAQPSEARMALYDNKGELLVRIARAASTKEKAAAQALSTEKTLWEEQTALFSKKGEIERSRTALTDEMRRAESEASRWAAGRSYLSACVAQVRRSYR